MNANSNGKRAQQRLTAPGAETKFTAESVQWRVMHTHSFTLDEPLDLDLGKSCYSSGTPQASVHTDTHFALLCGDYATTW